MSQRRHAVGIELESGPNTTAIRTRAIMRFLQQLYDTVAADGIEEEITRTQVFVVVEKDQVFSLSTGIQAFCGSPCSFFRSMADSYDDVSFFPAGYFPHVVPGMRYVPTLLVPTVGSVNPWSMMKIPSDLIRWCGNDTWPNINAVAVWLWTAVMKSSVPPRSSQICYAGVSIGGGSSRVQPHTVPHTVDVLSPGPWDDISKSFLNDFERYRDEMSAFLKQNPRCTNLDIWTAYDRGSLRLPMYIEKDKEPNLEEVQYAGIGDWAQYREFRGSYSTKTGPGTGEPSPGSISARSFDYVSGECTSGEGEDGRGCCSEADSDKTATPTTA